MLHKLIDEFIPKRMMKKNKFECCGELFYTLKKNYLGKPSAVFHTYNTRTWNQICVTLSKDVAEKLISQRYEVLRHLDVNSPDQINKRPEKAVRAKKEEGAISHYNIGCGREDCQFCKEKRKSKK